MQIKKKDTISDALLTNQQNKRSSYNALYNNADVFEVQYNLKNPTEPIATVNVALPVKTATPAVMPVFTANVTILAPAELSITNS